LHEKPDGETASQSQTAAADFTSPTSAIRISPVPVEPPEALLDRRLKSRRERHGGDALEDLARRSSSTTTARRTRGRVQYLVEKIYERAGLRAALPKQR
jgi:hypothetical protein